MHDDITREANGRIVAAVAGSAVHALIQNEWATPKTVARLAAKIVFDFQRELRKRDEAKNPNP